MKKNKITKIIAFIALFWIIIWIIWTWILIIFWEETNIKNSEETTENEFKNLIKSQTWINMNYGSWNIESSNSWSIILEETR